MLQASVSTLLRAPCYWALSLSLLVGCAQVNATGKSPLAPPRMADDTIALEKCTIRFAHADPDLDDQVWREIDEECLPSALRARLAANGFRAGVIGAHLPTAIEKVVRENVTAPTRNEPAEVQAQPEEELGVLDMKPVDLLSEPKVRRSLWQTRAGHPGIIITAGERARIPNVAVLVRGEDGHVTGRNYERVMGALSMKAMAEHDGRVRIEVIPELEHGEPRSRFVAGDGMIKADYRPETVLFKDLQINALLAPGQTLVLGTRADKPGSLGSHFFTEQGSAGTLEQKMLLVRVEHSPGDDAFRSGEIPDAQ